MAWSPYSQEGVTGGDAQQQRSFFDQQMQNAERKRQMQQMQKAPQSAPPDGQAAPRSDDMPTASSSPVSSTGRVTAAPPPSTPDPRQSPASGPTRLNDYQGQLQQQNYNGPPPNQFQTPSWVQAERGSTPQQVQSQDVGQAQNTASQVGLTGWKGPEDYGQVTEQQKLQGKEDWRRLMEARTGNPNFWQDLQQGTPILDNPGLVWVQAPNGTWGTMEKTQWDAQRRGGLPSNVPDAALYQAGNLGNTAFATYDPAKFNIQTPGAYQKTDMAQWNGPNQAGLDEQQRQLFQRMLANPHTMNQDVVSAMRNQNREGALGGMNAANQAMNQRFASMGRMGGGMQQTAEMGNREAATKQMLAGNRDIMLAKAERDRADELAAAAGSSAFQTGQMGRYDVGYKNTLLGQQARATENQYGQEDAWKRSGFNLEQALKNADQQHLGYESRFKGQEAAQQRVLDQEKLRMAQADAAMKGWQTSGDWSQQDLSRQLQEKLGMGQLGLEGQRLAQQGSQFDRTFGEGQRQFNVSSGMDATKMNLGTAQSFQEYLAKLGLS